MTWYLHLLQSDHHNNQINVHHYSLIERKESESEVAQSCLTLCHPVDSSLPGSSAHGIFQARILEWVAISFSRRSSQPRASVYCIILCFFNIFPNLESHSVLAPAGLVLLSFTLLCFTDIEVFWFFCLFVCKLKVCGNPVSSMSTGSIFSNSICPLHASVSHFGNPHNISNYFIIIVSALVICNQRSLMLLLIFQGSHKAHSWETEHLSNKCYMPSPCSTGQASPVSPPLLWPPYDLRHNNTEMRTINSPLIASNFSGERVPWLSL